MESVVDDVNVQENWLRQKEELKAWAAAQGGSTDLHKVFQWLSWSWLWWWRWSWSWSWWRRAVCQNLGQGRNMMKIIKMMKSLFKRVPICPYPAYWIGHRCLDWLLSEQWSESVPCLDLPIRRNSLWRCLFIFDPPLYLWARLETNRKCWKQKKIERKSGLGQRCQYLKCQKKKKREKVRWVGGWRLGHTCQCPIVWLARPAMSDTLLPKHFHFFSSPMSACRISFCWEFIERYQLLKSSLHLSEECKT